MLRLEMKLRASLCCVCGKLMKEKAEKHLKKKHTGKSEATAP